MISDLASWRGGAGPIAIIRREALPFDETWLDRAASVCWDCERASTIWTNIMLLPPTSPVALFNSATTDLLVADRFDRGSEAPEMILPLLDKEAAA